ncbi:MAG: hypothetical protein Q4F83_11135 [Eubacteriales bacterium]|nr:hypothetical protein [Eubacteriales bacterium]
MTAIRIIATALDILFALIFLYFLNGLTWEKDKAPVIGFGSLEICLLLNLVCIWWG